MTVFTNSTNFLIKNTVMKAGKDLIVYIECKLGVDVCAAYKCLSRDYSLIIQFSESNRFYPGEGGLPIIYKV